MYVTYAELFSFVLVLCAVITLVVALSNHKRKYSKKDYSVPRFPKLDGVICSKREVTVRR